MNSSRRLFEAFRRDEPRDPASSSGATPHDRGTTGGGRRYLGAYLTWLRPFARPIAGVFGLSAVSAVLTLVLPRATMYVIDDVLPSGDLSLLHRIGAVVLGVIVAQQALEFSRNWKLARLNARVLAKIRQRVYDHLLNLPLPRLSELKTGGIVSRVSGDVDSASKIVQLAVVSAAVATIRVVLTVGVLYWISWRLSLAASLLLPLLFLVSLKFVHRIRPIYRSVRADRAEIDGRVVETFAGIRVARAFGREKAESLRYAIRHHLVIRKRLLGNLFEFAIFSGWGLLVPLVGLVTVWLGGVLVLRGQATIGGVIAFQMYLALLLMPVILIVKSYGDMQQGVAALERLFDILQEPGEQADRPGAIDAPERIESIELDQVGFSYGENRVLESLSLKVPGGATIALVGPSGAGKTTVTNLIMRFFDPDQGAIRLNGIDLRELRLRSYRRLLGLVQQDVFLFDGTIAENIAYGRPSASESECIEAARRANAHDFILALPDGYASQVGERGVRLSGGQAQRISIARAILADPRILILDEATSSLDSESEHGIQTAMAELVSARTTFIIAHRLSTVVSADRIVVLDGGRIAESGTHDELIAAGGIYRAMVERQRRKLDPGQGEILADDSWARA